MKEENGLASQETPNAEDTEDQHREKMKALQMRQRQARRQKTVSRGILLVHTGDGKGKSSSAFGVAIRAAGHGQKVGIVQFIKGTWKTGEQAALARFPEIEHVVSGDGFTWDTQDRTQDIASAERGWGEAQRMIEAARVDSKAYQVIILDELNIALRYDYLRIEDVVEVLKNKPAELSIVVTGRDAKAELIEIADTVSEMRCVKHAYEAGVRARRGVEF
ncbi:MAG: cob(I)yrinic acid a,c-diamide adenosyltransferase [Myxococcota bacterium]